MMEFRQNENIKKNRTESKLKMIEDNNENENKEIQDIKEMGTPNVPNPQRKDIY